MGNITSVVNTEQVLAALRRSGSIAGLLLIGCVCSATLPCATDFPTAVTACDSAMFCEQQGCVCSFGSCSVSAGPCTTAASWASPARTPSSSLQQKRCALRDAARSSTVPPKAAHSQAGSSSDRQCAFPCSCAAAPASAWRRPCPYDSCRCDHMQVACNTCGAVPSPNAFMWLR